MITCLIVDDEAPGRRNLRLALAAHPDWRPLAECDSAAAARAAQERTPADVVFLDIQMPGGSGLDLAREWSRLAAPPLIVFVTAHDQHALDAFEVHALDYLLKPIDDRRLAQAVQRAAEMLAYRHAQRHGNGIDNGNGINDGDGDGDGDGYRAALRNYAAAQPLYAEALSVRSVGRIEQIKVRDILWLQSAGNYVELHLAARTVLHRVPLARLEQMLPPGDFLRVHRTALVRRDQIRQLAAAGDGRYALTLDCGAQLAVSERHVQQVKACVRGL